MITRLQICTLLTLALEACTRRYEDLVADAGQRMLLLGLEERMTDDTDPFDNLQLFSKNEAVDDITVGDTSDASPSPGPSPRSEPAEQASKQNASAKPDEDHGYSDASPSAESSAASSRNSSSTVAARQTTEAAADAKRKDDRDPLLIAFEKVGLSKEQYDEIVNSKARRCLADGPAAGYGCHLPSGQGCQCSGISTCESNDDGTAVDETIQVVTCLEQNHTSERCKLTVLGQCRKPPLFWNALGIGLVGAIAAISVVVNYVKGVA